MFTNPNVQTIAYWVCGGVLLNLPFIALGPGTFPHGLFVFGIVVLMAVPTAIVGFILFVTTRNAHRPGGHSSARVLLLTALLFSSPLASYLIGRQVIEAEIQSAKSYCESLIPRIEEYRRHHGEYPREIELIGELPAVPRMIRAGRFYHSNGSEFSFSVDEPRGMFNGHQYDSDWSGWHEWD